LVTAEGINFIVPLTTFFDSNIFTECLTINFWVQIASTGNVFVIGFKTGILKLVAVPLADITEEQPSKLIEIQVKYNHFQ
jgi:hypothetical protein